MTLELALHRNQWVNLLFCGAQARGFDRATFNQVDLDVVEAAIFQKIRCLTDRVIYEFVSDYDLWDQAWIGPAPRRLVPPESRWSYYVEQDGLGVRVREILEKKIR